MNVLLDTHAWVWSFADSAQLSAAARRAIAEAGTVMVSPVSLFEIGQKVRLGKWPGMDAHVNSLPEILHEQGAVSAPFTPEIALHAALRDWAHRDPFDRLLASTAQLHDLTLISCDATFAGLPAVRVVW